MSVGTRETAPPHGGGTQVSSQPGPVAVGVDLVDVGRLTRLLALRGSNLTDRVFTGAELATCRADVRRLAARMAAKEAASKALGLGIGPIGWRDVEVCPDPDGRPRIALRGAALEAACTQGLDSWAVSLAHDSTQAVAIVVAVRTGGWP